MNMFKKKNTILFFYGHELALSTALAMELLSDACSLDTLKTVNVKSY